MVSEMLNISCLLLLGTLITKSDEKIASDVNFKDANLILEINSGNNPGQVAVVGVPEGGGWMWPSDFVVDHDGNIWILDRVHGVDRENNILKFKGRIQKFNKDGNFLLQYPDNPSFSKPIDCKKIKVDPIGNVVIGPFWKKNEKYSNLAVIDKNGKFQRKIPFYVPRATIVDFAINSLGEIVYKNNKDLIVSNLKGEIKYSMKNNSNIECVSPYSNYIISKEYDENRTEKYIKHEGEVKKQIKSEVKLSDKIGKALSNVISYEVVQCDAQGNMFIWCLVKHEPYTERVLFYNTNSNSIKLIPNCPKFSTNYHRSAVDVKYTTDKDGNLYQMELAPPENAEIDNTKIHVVEEGKPILRVWKWARIKE